MDGKNSLLIEILTGRTAKNMATGGDGYISTSTLSFDIGLNTRTIRRALDGAVETGLAERRYNGIGKPYSYRIKGAACS